MAKLLKAMKRPAALRGVPMVPLLTVVGVTIIVAIWTSIALLLFLPIEFLVMKSLTRNEPLRFNLIAVWLRVRGNPVTNGAIVIHTQRLKSDPGGNLLS